ncbi:GNAT family N-acetyltransferase [Streptomyces sp. NPDC005863]|uniref:GNAT family N-acetyltransferase n=1 Tax=unclassified Streptomyces TaxID=2593676 RepID=UPI0033D0C1D4
MSEGAGLRVRHGLAGAELLGYAEGVRSVYAEAFGQPPWNEDPAQADRYLERLADEAGYTGFTGAVALEGTAGRGPGPRGREPRVLGFASAWPTGYPLPDTRSYPLVTAALGARRTEEWLGGALQVDELAVRPSAHGRGVGRALLAAVTGGAPEGRCWLLTSPLAAAAVRFYRRAGWHQVTHPGEGGPGPVLFLGPGHPAAPRGAERLDLA